MAKVKIQGHASGTGTLTVTAPNTSTDRTITLPDATATIATTTDVAARLPSITDNGDATAITIDSSENVGIGTASPSSLLEVKAGSNSTTDYPITVLNSAESVTTGYGAYGIDQSASSAYTIDVHDDLVIKSNTGENLRILENGGITFNGDTSSANALDDYEEGTFTPTFFVDGSASGITYDHQNGYYTKIGKLVSVTVSMQITSKGSGSGNVTFRGLPFTVKDVLGSTSLDGGSVTFGYRAGFANISNIGMMAYGGTDYVGGYVETGNDGNLDATFTDGEVTNSCSFRLSLHYFAD